MMLDFEELDYQETELGAISLRRRADPLLGGKIVYEVRLGEEFLMSSLFTVAEIQLARLGLAELEGSGWDIVVGGLGLGYTAAAVLDDSSVRSLDVIEIMRPVIDWHNQGLVPMKRRLAEDPRCSLVHADFFQWASRDADPCSADHTRQVHAVLLDIDHTPDHWLSPGNRSFYTADGLAALASRLRPGGVFGLWSNDLPDEGFTELLEAAFASAESKAVTFPNPYTGDDSSNSIYLAHKSF